MKREFMRVERGKGVAIGFARDVQVLVDLAESLRHKVERQRITVAEAEPSRDEWDLGDWLADASREATNLRITLGKALLAARRVDPEASTRA